MHLVLTPSLNLHGTTIQFLRKRIKEPMPPSMMDAGPAANEGMRDSVEGAD